MRKIIFALIAVILILLSACGQSGGTKNNGETPSLVPKSEADAPPEGSVAFEVINNTGGDIYEVYVAVAETEQFSEDLLKERIIKTGESMNVYAIPTDGVQYYDIKALREDGNYYTWLNVPLGTFKKIIMALGDEGPQFTTE